MEKLSISDYIMLAITLLSIITGYLRGLNRLHPTARKWLRLIGEPFIVELAKKASEISSLTPLQRRDYVVKALKDYVLKTSGVQLPSSIANYLVEHACQFIKRETQR